MFYKHFDEPIERVVIAARQPIVTFQNADSARTSASSWRPGARSGQNFFVNANYTFVDSKITLLPEQRTVQTSLERPLAGQSKNLFNVMAEYTLSGFSARLLFNYFGDRISDVGSNEAPDIIEQGRGSLDLVFSQRFGALQRPAHAREPDRQRLPVHAGRSRDAARSSSSAARSAFSFGYNLF